MVAEVIVDIKAYAVDRVFDYIIPAHLELSVGMRVRVPFGTRVIEGYVILIKEQAEVPTRKLKEIIEASKIQFLNEELILLAKEFSQKTGSFQTSFLQAMLPKDITKRKPKMEIYISGIKPDMIGPKAKKQQEAASFLATAELPFSMKTFKATFGGATILAMKKVGALETIEMNVNTQIIPMVIKPGTVELRAEQCEVIECIGIFPDLKPILLQGVTGSGKTEVYLNLIEKAIKVGKTALLLVPEIGLTPQMITRFENRFTPDRIAILHSGLTGIQRFEMWAKIKEKKIDIVVGTRSAIFAPLTNIGIIIVDEEHDTSYKQDNMPTYHAVDIAIWRANYQQAKILLASATPSLESFLRAEKAVYHYLTLQQRINQEPQVEIIDMRKQIGNPRFRYFSQPLVEAIEGALARKEQIMVLLNRRGYAPTVQCHACGKTPECPNCDTTLNYHKNGQKLVCHYCQYTQAFERLCPSCGAEQKLEGVGIQKIEEQAQELFPSARIMRVDKDLVKKYEDYGTFYDTFLAGGADMMIGTQMITKGFDFPNVTVVGVLETDQSLHMPDFRAREKTYQLLRQVVGRAGRSKKIGYAFVQTYDADHPLFAEIKKDNFREFALAELEQRKVFKHPPYWHLSDIIVVSENQHEASHCINFMYNQLCKLSEHATIYPPASTFIGRVNNKYYYHILLKYKNSELILKNVQKLLAHMMKKNPKVYTYIQVNPYNFL
ncbi:primosome assembly protein PriA [Erysipelotrichaceae bacterium]|nr:primosome assembly protein PriA [Erysipelotrichaceae bacterium]